MPNPLIGKRVRTHGIDWLCTGQVRIREPATGVVRDVAPGPGWRILVEFETPDAVKGVLATFDYGELVVQPPIERPRLRSVPDDDLEK